MIYDPNTGQWAQRPAPSQNTAPGGLTTGAYGTFLRSPDARQTVQGQMVGLLKSDTPYMKINEQKGQQFAAGRGLLNSTLAGQAGRRAAIEGALPIAAADATTFAQAGAQNQDALNRMAALDLQRQAATAQAYGGGNTYNALDSELEHDRRKELMRLENQLNREASREDRDWRSGESAADREWRTGESGLDRGLEREFFWENMNESQRDRAFRADQASQDRGLTREQWDREQAERARDREFEREERGLDRQFQLDSMSQQQRFQLFGDVIGMTMGTMFSSPDFFRDPDGAAGFINFFTGDVFGGLFSRFFGGGSGGDNNANKPATDPGGG
jgi:hypothetical protein